MMQFLQASCFCCLWLLVLSDAVLLGNRENAYPRLPRQLHITNGTSHSPVGSVFSPQQSQIDSPTPRLSATSSTSVADILSATPLSTKAPSASTASSKDSSASPPFLSGTSSVPPKASPTQSVISTPLSSIPSVPKISLTSNETVISTPSLSSTSLSSSNDTVVSTISVSRRPSLTFNDPIVSSIPTISPTSSNSTVVSSIPKISSTSSNSTIVSSIPRISSTSSNSTVVSSILKISSTSSNSTIVSSIPKISSISSNSTITSTTAPTNVKQPLTATKPPFSEGAYDGKNISFAGFKASGSPVGVRPSGNPQAKSLSPSFIYPRPVVASTGAYSRNIPLSPGVGWYPIESLKILPTGAFPTIGRPKVKPTGLFSGSFLPSGFLYPDQLPRFKPTGQEGCSGTVTVTSGRPVVFVTKLVTSTSNKTLTITVDGPIPSSLGIPSGGRIPPGPALNLGAARSSGAARPLYPVAYPSGGVITLGAIRPKITTITPKPVCLATATFSPGEKCDLNCILRQGSFRPMKLDIAKAKDGETFGEELLVGSGQRRPLFLKPKPGPLPDKGVEGFNSIQPDEPDQGQNVPIALVPSDETPQSITETLTVQITSQVVIQKSPDPTPVKDESPGRLYVDPKEPALENGSERTKPPSFGNEAPGAGPKPQSPEVKNPQNKNTSPLSSPAAGIQGGAQGPPSGQLGSGTPKGVANGGGAPTRDASKSGTQTGGSSKGSSKGSSGTSNGGSDGGLKGAFLDSFGQGSNGSPNGDSNGVGFGLNSNGNLNGVLNGGGLNQNSKQTPNGVSTSESSNEGLKGAFRGSINGGSTNGGGTSGGGTSGGGTSGGGTSGGGTSGGGTSGGGISGGGTSGGGINGGSSNGGSFKQGSNGGPDGFFGEGSSQGGFNGGGSNGGDISGGGFTQGSNGNTNGASNEGGFTQGSNGNTNGVSNGGGFSGGLKGAFAESSNQGGSNAGGSGEKGPNGGFNQGFAGFSNGGSSKGPGGAFNGDGSSGGVFSSGSAGDLGGVSNSDGSNGKSFGGSVGGPTGNFNGAFNQDNGGNSVSNEGNFSPDSLGQPAPFSVVTIGNIPITLRPNNVVIGTQTFTPGASPSSFVYNGQTFGLDSLRLSSPQTTVAIPQAAGAAGAAPPLVTAGGQVFTVGPSGLEAPGTTVAIPGGPGASSFEYKGQTFKINPSQIIATDRLFTIPDAAASTPPAAFVFNGETISIDGSRVIAPSATFTISPGSSVIVYKGQTLTIQPSQIVAASTTIPLANANQGPITAPPSAITAAGLAFALGPGAAIIGSSTYSFLPGQTPTTIVYQGTTISIGPNGIGFAGTTIPIPTPPPSFSTVTAGGLTFTVGPSQAVFGERTFSIGPNIAPTTTVINGKTISIGPNGIGLAGTTVPLPSPGDAALSTITADGLTFTVGPSKAVIEGRTFSIEPGSAPTTTVIDGKTLSIGPQGIGLAGTTVPLPNPTAASFSTVTAGGLTFAVNPSQALIDGRTFAIGPGSAPITTVINGQIVSIGPHGIGLATTTVALPPSPSGYTVLTEGDLTFSLSPSRAVIDGKTYIIAPGAAPITTTINGQSVTIGPKGIEFAGTTAAIPSATTLAGASVVTIDGLTITLEPTAAVIGGKTYAIGIGAHPTTIVIGTETISLGPGGVGLPTTTIAPAPAGFTGGVGSGVAPCSRPRSGSLIFTVLAGIVLLFFGI